MVWMSSKPIMRCLRRLGRGAAPGRGGFGRLQAAQGGLGGQRRQRIGRRQRTQDRDQLRVAQQAPDPGAGQALFGVGEESLEVQLFDWDKIPTDEIAFPTVHWMLGHEREVMQKGYSGPFGNGG